MIKVFSSAKLDGSLVGLISKETGYLVSYISSKLETSRQKLMKMKNCRRKTMENVYLEFVFLNLLCVAKGTVLFFLTSLLEYNCFTMVCYFLLYKQSESAIHIHISLYLLHLASPSHPPYPTSVGGHKKPS